MVATAVYIFQGVVVAFTGGKIRNFNLSVDFTN